jgi:nitroreductase
MTKEASPDFPIHDLLARRWSPYGFSDRPVPENEVRSLFEAARWAPSSYNEQPWRFFVALRSDGEQFAKLLSCLVEANQAWAKHAGVLVITATRRRFQRNGRENLACEHDLGLAVANLSVEATARGLAVHQMIGIDRDRAREALSIPDDASPVTGIAIGHALPADQQPDEAYRERDQAPRSRRPLSETVFRDAWGETSPLVKPR